MDTLRLEGSTVRGIVQSRPINCSLRSSPPGLVLPSGSYLLGVENTPIYGWVVSVQPLAIGKPGAAQVEFKGRVEPGSPAEIKFGPGSPSEIKFVPGKVAMTPAAAADLWKAPDPSVGKWFDTGAASAKFWESGGGGAQKGIIATRQIGHQSLVAQAGFSDLVDAVRQAGGAVTLIVP